MNDNLKHTLKYKVVMGDDIDYNPLFHRGQTVVFDENSMRVLIISASVSVEYLHRLGGRLDNYDEVYI